MPQVSAGLGVAVDFAVLKGRSNYVCLQRVAEVGTGGIQGELGAVVTGDGDRVVAGGSDGEGEGEDSGDARDRGATAPATEGVVDQVRSLLAWSQTTKTGDRGDLAFEPSDRAWNMVSVGPRECPGRFNCPSGDRCFAEAARERASLADIVVVNTYLYGAHLASGRAVLPDHDAVVFDEAHELEEVMTSSLGVEVTAGRFRTLALTARSLVDPGGAEQLETLAELGDRMQEMVAERVGERVLNDRPRAADTARPEDRELDELLARAADLARRVTDALRAGGSQGSLLGAADGGLDLDRASRTTRAVTAATHLAEDLHRFGARSDGEVAWVDGTRRSPRLRLSPIDVGPALAALLWNDVTAVMTSATIPPRLVERVGLAGFETEELDVGSPFDYRSHSLLYVARHLPDRRAAGAEEALHEELALLLDAAGGRTLALFTSRRATERAADALATGLPVRALAPGRSPEGPPPRGVRPRRELVPLRHDGLLAGRRHPRSGTVAGDTRPSALPAPRRPVAPGPTRPRRRQRLLAGRPPPGGHTAGPGCGPPHPHGRRPWGGGGARPAPGHGVVPRRPALDAAPHAPDGRARRGGIVPAPGARRVGLTPGPFITSGACVAVPTFEVDTLSTVRIGGRPADPR